MKNKFEIKQPAPVDYVFHYMTIRKAIGISCFFLPLILIVGNFIVGKCFQIEASISKYYYTAMGDVFVGILSAISLFLILYKGFDRHENIATNLAGIFALAVAIFPTGYDDYICSVKQLDASNIRIYVHVISAFMFSLISAYISIFIFTKSISEKTPQKIIRISIYKLCGIVILLSVGLIFVITIFPHSSEFCFRYKPKLWLEWIALLSFGIAWMTKGGFIFKDRFQKIEENQTSMNV